MNQADLRTMAEERILDAKVLLDGGRWAFAYYVAGYAIECALKSCVFSRMILTGGVFQDKKIAESCFTHNFGKLVELSGLKGELDARHAASPAFGGCWGIAIQWEETQRYVPKTQAEAERLYEAITQIPDGVLPWLRNYW